MIWIKFSFDIFKLQIDLEWLHHILFCFMIRFVNKTWRHLLLITYIYLLFYMVYITYIVINNYINDIGYILRK